MPHALQPYAMVVSAMVLLASNHAGAQDRYQRWTFEGDAIGSIPKGLQPAIGTWTVALEQLNRVVAQTASNADPVFNVALFNETRYGDVDIVVRMKPVAGKLDQGGGVFWRARDARNYYIARYNPLEDNFRVFKVVDGRRTMLQSAGAAKAPSWRAVRVTMRGDRITASLDAQELLDVRDATFTEPGMVGLWTKADAQTWFDEFAVRVPPPLRAPDSKFTEFVARPTKKFEIKNDRPILDGNEIHLWGIRCGNALVSEAVLQRHIHCLDDYVAHGVNLIGVYLQGCNAAWPNPDAGHNGFGPDGRLKPELSRRLEELVRAADQRGMVVMVGLFTPRKDQEMQGEAAVKRGIEETSNFLKRRQLRNVFIDLMHEFNNPARADLEIFREPDGANKKAKLAAWFAAVAPEYAIGVCPSANSGTADTFPGMGVRLIQKDMPIPKSGFVVNVEMQRFDTPENEGVYSPAQISALRDIFETYKNAPNAALMFHSSYTNAIGGKAGTGPNPEIGGNGTAEDDRGARVYFDWLRKNVGRWSIPKRESSLHVD